MYILQPILVTTERGGEVPCFYLDMRSLDMQGLTSLYFLTVPLYCPVGPYGARHICTDEVQLMKTMVWALMELATWKV